MTARESRKFEIPSRVSLGLLRERRSQGVKARPDGTVGRSTRARARSTSFLLSFFRRNGSKKAE